MQPSSSHPRARRRRNRRVAGVAAVAALAVVLAGCSSTKDNANTSGTPLPGITDSTVKIGFTVVDGGKLSSSLGFKSADYGGVEGQTKAINAVVQHINANGGMGGRQVQADIKTYISANDSPDTSQAQCSAYTQDSRVFAVVLDGGLQNNAVPCYAAANTLVLDQTLVAHDQTQFENTSPYLWSPTHPEYSSFVKAQLDQMNKAGFFTGNSGVLIMPADIEVARRATDQIVKPFLSSIGVTRSQVAFIDSTNTGTLGATAAAALTAGKNGKFNRVVAIGGARIESVALSDQAAANYPSTWSISSYDSPPFIQNNPETIVTALRNGMTGIGYSPAIDVYENTVGPAFPDPTNPQQVLCTNIINQAGATPPENRRNNWRSALQYCDAAFFLKAVLDKAPAGATLTGAQFKDAAAQIGTTYRSSMTFGASWGPNVYAGTNAAQDLKWDPTTLAFVYGGTTIQFGAPASAAAAPNSAVPAPAAPNSAVPAPAAPNSAVPAPAAPNSAVPAPAAPNSAVPAPAVPAPAPAVP